MIENINKILNTARAMGASDVHLVSGSNPYVRIDGEIQRFDAYTGETGYDQELTSMMRPEIREKFENGADADFAWQDENSMRYRVNVFRKQGLVSAVFRLLSDEISDFESLNLPEVLKRYSLLTRGLVLVTGPTGSGKSTTLSAMVDYANRNRKGHIITIEDPVEYVHENRNCIISQRELGTDVSSFKEAIRSALREDPDIILVGEMRDLETISAALTAAETGHLVFSTLHTTGAAKTIDRIIDVFPPHQQQQVRIQLAASLKCVASQQLVKKIKGGRTAAFEIMVTTDAVANMIREEKTFQINSAIQTGFKDGMVMLDRSLSQLTDSGIISLEEALENCTGEKELRRFLNMR